MPYTQTITHGLPEGWSIVQDHWCSDGSFRLMKDSIWLASGKEYPRDGGIMWKITHVVATETRPAIEKVMEQFRSYQYAEFEAKRASFLAECKADGAKRADAAIRAILGVTP